MGVALHNVTRAMCNFKTQIMTLRPIAYLIPFVLIFASFTNVLAQVDSTHSSYQLQELRNQLLEIANKISQLESTAITPSIDSTKSKKVTATDTAWVVFRGDSVYPFYVNNLADNAAFRAKSCQQKLNKISFFEAGKVFDSLTVVPQEQNLVVKSMGETYLIITPNDAQVSNKTNEELAQLFIAELRENNSTQAIFTSNKDLLFRILKLTVIILILTLLIKLLNKGYVKLKRFIVSLKGERLRAINIKGFEVINESQMVKISLLVTRIVRLLTVLFILSLSLPLIFSLFPWTESLAETLLGYFLDPIKEYFWLFIHYIPNLISIFIISYIGYFVLKFIHYLANEVEIGNLEIQGFYPDWAKPTYNLVRFAIYVILLIFIFPFLPGSDSPIFKGVSVFVGILITIGSSSSVNNIVAGLILTYMRPFKTGDRIMLENIMGFVTEKTLLVTRLRTSKQEIITIPNSKILATNIINYSTSIQENDGVIVHSKITIGYDVPWRKVHKALLKAADNIETISKDPKPFVLQTSLDDFYVGYEINAYVTNIKTIIGTQSKLNENIQDVFRDEGIEIMSPHYNAWRGGEESTIPKKVKEDKTFKAEQVDDHTPELDQQTEEEAKLAKKKAKAPKSEAPKSFTDLIQKVTKEDKDENGEAPQ